MDKTLDSAQYTVGSLLGRYERRKVVLPPFQRPYSWEKGHVVQFFDDLALFGGEFGSAPTTATYFLGAIVVINRAAEILLLDGQQRLATATILLAAMRDAARELDETGFTKGSDLARDIQRELIEKTDDPAAWTLTLGELDEPFFIKRIKSDPPQAAECKLKSHQLIENAYRLCSESVAKRIVGKSRQEAVREIRSLHDALVKGMVLVAIAVSSEEQAFSIFETLNDRGLRLSVPDLVLNLLMRRAPDDTARAIVRGNWNEMLRELGTRDVGRFLRHMWVSQYGDLKSEGLYAAIKAQVEQSPMTSAEYAELCADECEDYVALFEVRAPISKAALNELSGLLKYLQVFNALPLLLSGLRCLEPTDFEKLISGIVATHVRFALAANQNPLTFESAMYEAARTMRVGSKAGQASGKLLANAIASLKALAVTDDVVEAGVVDLVLERSQAVWVMPRLANAMQSDTREIGMDVANLEHVFPQRAGAAWPNKDELEPFIWHIGNLTVLGEKLNGKAKNKAFKDKVALSYSKSEITMTKAVAACSDWSPAVIRERAKELARYVRMVWPPLS